MMWLFLVYLLCSASTSAQNLVAKRYNVDLSACLDGSTLTCDGEAVLLESTSQDPCLRISDVSLSCTEATSVTVSCVTDEANTQQSLALSDSFCATSEISSPGQSISESELLSRQSLFALEIRPIDSLDSCDQAEVTPMLRLSCDFVLGMDQVPSGCSRVGVDRIDCPYLDNLPDTIFFRCYDGDLEASVSLDTAIYYCGQHSGDGSYGGQVSNSLELHRLCEDVYVSAGITAAAESCSGQCSGDSCAGQSCRLAVSGLNVEANGRTCAFGVGGSAVPERPFELPFEVEDSVPTSAPMEVLSNEPVTQTTMPTSMPMTAPGDGTDDYSMVVERFDANVSSCDGASTLTCSGDALLIESEIEAQCVRSSDATLSCANASSVLVSCVSSEQDSRPLTLTDGLCDTAVISEGPSVDISNVTASQAWYKVDIETIRTDSCQQSQITTILRLSCDFVIGVPNLPEGCNQVDHDEVHCIYGPDLPETIEFRCYDGNLLAAASLENAFFDCAATDDSGSFGGNATLDLTLLQLCNDNYETAGKATTTASCSGECVGSACDEASCRLVANNLDVGATAVATQCTFGVGFQSLPDENASTDTNSTQPPTEMPSREALPSASPTHASNTPAPTELSSSGMLYAGTLLPVFTATTMLLLGY